MSDPSPLESLFTAARDLAGELTDAVPRLVRRSKDQFSALSTLADKLPCAGIVGDRPDEPANQPSAPVSPVANIMSAPSARKGPAPKKATAKKATAKKATARKAPAKKDQTSAPGHPLGIASYDSLAASQVIPRLDALSPAELEAVRSYEVGARNRRTILGRIAQLQRA